MRILEGEFYSSYSSSKLYRIFLSIEIYNTTARLLKSKEKTSLIAVDSELYVHTEWLMMKSVGTRRKSISREEMHSTMETVFL